MNFVLSALEAEDHKFQASLDNSARPCFRKKKKGKVNPMRVIFSLVCGLKVHLNYTEYEL